MSKEKLIKSPLPTYSKGEEIFNYVTHIVGAAMGIIMLFFSIVYFIINKINFGVFLSLIIFNLSCIILYTMSSLYHALSPKILAKKIFRIIDHCTIYILIAGTYTPLCVICLSQTNWMIIILLIEWSIALVGVLINAIDLNNIIVKIISMIFYIISGWLIIFFPDALHLINTNTFIFILLGGIVYTIGSILYGVGSKKKWFHSIFHICCLLGTLLQTIGILLLLI